MRSLLPETHEPGLAEPGRLLTVVFPLTVYPVMILSIFVYYDFWLFMKSKEGGVEWLAIGCLLIGAVFGARLLLRYRSLLPAKWLVVWFALGTLGMVFLAGEEMSWGQHLGLWSGEDLPDSFQEINDQNETNIHNIVGFGNTIDRGSTNAVVIGTFFAFIILPLIQRMRGKLMPYSDPGYWFWPTKACFWAGMGVVIIMFPKRIYEAITGETGSFDWRHSEIHEFYIAMLMLTYMVSAHARLRDYASKQAAPADASEAA